SLLSERPIERIGMSARAVFRAMISRPESVVLAAKKQGSAASTIAPGSSPGRHSFLESARRYDGQGSRFVGRNTFRGEGVVKASSKKKITKKRTKKAVTPTSQVSVRIKPLSALTDEALKSYFATLNGHKPGD